MVRIMYDVTTRIHVDHYGHLYDNQEVKELEKWLLENIGKPYEDWQSSLSHRHYVCIAVKTQEQQTLTALRWA